MRPSQLLEIPELGDDGEGDITTQVAAPPKEFKQHKEGLKSLAKICGEPSYKERLLQKCLRYDQGASKEDRRVVHSYAGTHVDWRWEHLEDVAGQMRWVYPVMARFL